jgi:Domain of unknown function (DUF4124)
MRSRRDAVCLAIAVGALAWCAAAFAGQYYKWTDAHGTAHYSAEPPRDGHAKLIRVRDGQPPTAAPVPGKVGTDNAKAAGSALHQANKVAVQNNCITARHNLSTLQKDPVVVHRSPDEINKALDAQQRKQAIADARAQETKYCRRGN